MSFTGGDKLRAKLADMAARLDRPATLNVGFLAGATYANGTPVAMVAAIQEFGAPAANIPPRPFFRPMIAAKSPRWGETLGALLVAHDYDAKTALGMMGQGIAGQLRESIVAVTDPPLAPATVARKGFNKPLVSTGHMLQSIDFEISDE